MQFFITKLRDSEELRELLREMTIALIISMILICLQLSGQWRYHEMCYEYVWHKLVISDVEAIAGTTEPKETFAKNADMLKNLQREKWDQLNVGERLDVMQVLVNVEARAMHIPHKVIVYAQEREEQGFLAAYMSENSSILINRNHLEYDDPKKVANSICHEMRHCLQYQQTLAFKALPKLDQELNQYEPEGIIANEFDNYTELDIAKSNREEYSGQLCEIEARAYAEYTVADYLERVKALDKHRP